jgi:hypothetical protein
VTSYRDLVLRLSELEPALYLFGGVAEDVLLEGSLDRPHGDLDVLVRRSELHDRMEQVQHLGFTRLEVYYEPLPGRPLVLGGTSSGLNLEFGIAGATEGGLQRVEVTGDLFSSPPVMLEGTAVHIVSPLALYQVRDAFMRLGTFGVPREKDITIQARLREHLREHGTPNAMSPSLFPFTDRPRLVAGAPGSSSEGRPPNNSA